ncbi:hypothetical protein [Bacillus sp. B1-b2]|uniref:hypothetical protein n=1 Tax=Bacillus sp. B1-b2 TaxID=2653201 RepID=UPI00126275D4|nr:hypothetical protein [Bacillus sp. B1-b2]KAB7668701.1 hypothetical protein F9279_12785 [Bacillus sp. B1-b2]
MLSFKAKVEFKNIQQEVNEQLFKDVSILRKELKEMKMNYEEFKREVLSNILQLNKANQDLYEQLSVQNNQHTDTIQNLNEQLSHSKYNRL